MTFTGFGKQTKPGAPMPGTRQQQANAELAKYQSERAARKMDIDILRQQIDRLTQDVARHTRELEELRKHMGRIYQPVPDLQGR